MAEMGEFVEIDNEVAILQGSVSQGDRRFKHPGLQCGAMAATAIGQTNVMNICSWTSEIVDKILEKGDILYRDILKKQKQQPGYLEATECEGTVEFPGTTVSIEAIQDREGCLMTGLFDYATENEELKLSKAVEKFQASPYKWALFTAGSMITAMMKEGDYLYYFDSHARSDKGLVKDNGTACVMRFAIECVPRRVYEIINQNSTGLGWEEFRSKGLKYSANFQFEIRAMKCVSWKNNIRVTRSSFPSNHHPPRSITSGSNSKKRVNDADDQPSTSAAKRKTKKPRVTISSDENTNVIQGGPANEGVEESEDIKNNQSLIDVQTDEEERMMSPLTKADVMEGLKCESCEKLFYNIRGFRLHEDVCKRKKLSAECKEKGIPTPPEALPKHKCPKCQKRFWFYERLRTHKKNCGQPSVHKKVTKFQCAICQTYCCSKDTLKEHEQYCKNVKLSKECEEKGIPLPPEALPTHKCADCQKMFWHRSSLYSHKEKCGKPVVKKTFKMLKCSICDKQFERPGRLRDHEQYCKNIKLLAECKDKGIPLPHEAIPTYKCKGCPKRFWFNKTLQAHQKKCGKPAVQRKVYVCRYCNTEIKSGGGLFNHEKVCIRNPYSVKKSKVCPYCGKVFKNPCSVGIHVPRCPRNPSPSKESFKCIRCSKAFQSKVGLSNHRKACDGQYYAKLCKEQGLPPTLAAIPKYKCQKCDKVFWDSTSLCVHKRNSHKDENKKDYFVCPFCTRVYKSWTGAKNHSKKCVNNPNRVQ